MCESALNVKASVLHLTAQETGSDCIISNPFVKKKRKMDSPSRLAANAKIPSQFKVCILLPKKMELIEGSETSAISNPTPGKHPKENILILF
jgi:hypothetical protein